MNDTKRESMIEDRPIRVLAEMQAQREVASSHYPADRMPFDEEMAQIAEFIGPAGEFGMAYESIICSLETIPFTLSGGGTVALIEAALLMSYKTDRDEDSIFDSRAPTPDSPPSTPRG